MKKWFLKGRTGRMLADYKTCNTPVHVARDPWFGSSIACVSTARKMLISVTLRGSSKCRRKQFRELKRYMESGQ